MKKNYFTVAGFFLLGAMSLTEPVFSQHSINKEDWINLFNGKDIKDWVPKINHHPTGENYGNTFRVEDGIVKIRYDKYDTFNEQFGHLYYKQPFSYYHLVFEYRIVGEWRKDAPEYTLKNSGVMFHSQDPATMPKDQNWPISIEFQLLAGLGDGVARPTGNMCSPGTDVVFQGKIDDRHCIPSASKTYEGDQWVKGEIIVLGDSLITHIINGDTVLQYSKPQIGGGVVANYDPKIKQDGKLLSEGFIALQSEGQPVDFRNIKILNLKGCMDPASKKYRSYFIKADYEGCR
jgi:hypothetical protein